MQIVIGLGGMPAELGVFSWLGIFVYMPDMAWWCLLTGVLLLVKIVLSRI